MKSNDYYTKNEFATLLKNNHFLSDASILISKTVHIGRGNVIYPNVVIELHDGSINIGNNNIFYPGTFILCQGGSVTIGDNNTFGPANCTLLANATTSNIHIGNKGRYSNGAQVMGKTYLGDGSQILGLITAQDCQLEDGQNFQHPDPDQRAPVMKGFGLARNIKLNVGEVLNGVGNLKDASVEQQSAYHPKAKSNHG